MSDVRYPICPINMFFEGDEEICRPSQCDFDLDSRTCSVQCKVNACDGCETCDDSCRTDG